MKISLGLNQYVEAVTLRPLTVPVAFVSGSKGGTGKSTIVANIVSLIDEPIAILDLGFDGNTTVSRLHKVEYGEGSGGFIEYMLYGSELAIVDSKEEPNVKIIPPGLVKGIKVARVVFNIPIEVLASRMTNMLATLSKLGMLILLIDMPSNPTFLGPLYPIMIHYSDIVNVVTEPGQVYSPMLNELYRWLSKVVDEDSVVNVIVNKYHEYFDGYPKEAGRYTIRGGVYVIRFDPVAMALTLKGELAVKYREASIFRRSLEEFAKELTNQVKVYLGVVGR
mgnify:FL=1